MRMSSDTLRERLARYVAWRLPRLLVYWCGMRLFVHATGGPWSHEESTGVTVTEALARWNHE